MYEWLTAKTCGLAGGLTEGTGPFICAGSSSYFLLENNFLF